MATTKLGLSRPQLFQLPSEVSVGAALVKYGHHAAIAVSSTVNGALLRRPRDDVDLRVGRRRPVLVDREIAVHHDGAQEAVALAGEHREDRMVGHFQVGSFFESIDEQLGRPCQRHWK